MSDAQSLLAPLDVNISTNFDSACGRPTTVGSSSRSGSTDVPVRDSTVTPDHPLASDLPLQPGAAPLLEFLGTSSLNAYFNGYLCDRSGLTSFRRLLCSMQPLPRTTATTRLFPCALPFRCVAYDLSLSCRLRWARRFVNDVFAWCSWLEVGCPGDPTVADVMQ